MLGGRTGAGRVGGGEKLPAVLAAAKALLTLKVMLSTKAVEDEDEKAASACQKSLCVYLETVEY